MQGFRGINASGSGIYGEPFEAAYALNFTNRRGLYGDVIGAITTRNGSADKPKFGLSGHTGDVATNNPTRALHKAYPDASLVSNGTVVRVLHDKLQTDTGSGFSNVAGITFNNTTSNPQVMEVGWPKKTFLVAMPGTNTSVGGLYVLEETGAAWKQDVPRYDPTVSPATDNVNSLAWMTQGSDGRVYVAGDYFDKDMRLSVAYSAVGTVGVSTDPTNVNQWTYPNGGVILVYAQGPRNMSAPLKCTGLAWLDGEVVAFTETGRYIIHNPGTGNETVDFQPGFGCISGKLVTEDPKSGKVLWWDTEGGYSWTGAGNPTRMTKQIFPYVGVLTLKDGGGDDCFDKFFSYVWLNQWITCARVTGGPGITTSTTAGEKGYGLNIRFIYDFLTGCWWFDDVQQTCVAIAHGGSDLGQLYFANEIDFNPSGAAQYKIFSYGYDEQDSNNAVWMDYVAGTGGSRTGDAIAAIWKSHKLHAGEPERKKRFDFLRLTDVQVNTGGGGAIGATASAFYDGSTSGVSMGWPTDPSTNFSHDLTNGHRTSQVVEYQLSVTSKRRTSVGGMQQAYEWSQRT
jgi:hypothetical protein